VVEEQKLRRRPQTWRLACQALVQESLVVLTRPQVGLADRESAFAHALAEPLPAGPVAWPTPPTVEEPGEADGAGDGADPTLPAASSGSDIAPPTATSGEAPDGDPVGG